MPCSGAHWLIFLLVVSGIRTNNLLVTVQTLLTAGLPVLKALHDCTGEWYAAVSQSNVFCTVLSCLATRSGHCLFPDTLVEHSNQQGKTYKHTCLVTLPILMMTLADEQKTTRADDARSLVSFTNSPGVCFEDVVYFLSMSPTRGFRVTARCKVTWP